MADLSHEELRRTQITHRRFLEHRRLKRVETMAEAFAKRIKERYELAGNADPYAGADRDWADARELLEEIERGK